MIISPEGVAANGFTIKNIAGCRLVFGSVPISELAMLTHGFSDKALMDTNLADRIGATFVIGEPESLGVLRKMDLPVSAKRNQDCRAASDAGLPRVAEWLHAGERGPSSEAMCKRIFGLPRFAGVSHPHDPDDLSRCLKFLDATGAHDKIDLMREVSPEWARLVGRWPVLVAVLKEEMPTKVCTVTYALMREAIELAAKECACTA